jgi:hypothetical protein
VKQIFGCKLGAKCTQIAPKSTDLSSPNHPVSHLECMAGTTGPGPATSAVTAFGALRHEWQSLLCPYWARDLCPFDLCPHLSHLRGEPTDTTAFVHASVGSLSDSQN